MQGEKPGRTRARLLVGIALAAAFGAGIVVGVVVGATLGGTPAGSPAAAPPRTARDARQVARPSDAAEEQGVSVASGKRPARDAGGEPSPTAAAAAHVPPTAEVVGQITGSVVATDGTPLAGVRIVAQPQPPGDVWSRSVGDDPELTAEEILAATREREAIRRGARGEAVTGEDGCFAIDARADTRHDVTARLEGWAIRARPSSALPGGAVAFVAEAVHVLTVDVRLPDGSEPPEARIRFETAGGRRWTTEWTPGGRTVDAPSGTWSVSAVAGADEALQSDAVERLFVGGERSSVTLALGGRPALALSLPTEPLRVLGRRVTVWLRRADDGATVTPEMLRTEGRRIEVDRGISFRNVLHDVAPGVYAIGASRRTDGTLETFENVRVGSGLLRHEIPLPRPDRADYLVVRALTAQGTPLSEGLTVRVRCGDAESVGRWGDGLVVLPGGSLAVRHPDPWYAGTSDGPFRVDVTSRDRGTAGAEYVRGPAPEVEVVLGEPPVLDVTLHGVTGTRYEGRLHVALVPDLGPFPSMHIARQAPGPDSEGRVRLAAEAPGAHWLLVGIEPPPGRPSNTYAITWKRLDLAPGANQAALRVPDLGTLRIEGLERPAAVSLAALPAWRLEVLPGTDGAAELRDLPPGRYVVTPYGSTFEPVTIEFPATDVVRF